jgi:kinesin family protein 18/19
MLGTESQPGVMALTLADLFNKINNGDVKKPNETVEVSMTYLEIYNENIRDLLSGKPDVLDLREDYSHGVVVAGITAVTVTTAEEVMMFLRKGNRNRSQEPTGANEVSSRSHAVLQVSLILVLKLRFWCLFEAKMRKDILSRNSASCP